VSPETADAPEWAAEIARPARRVIVLAEIEENDFDVYETVKGNAAALFTERHRLARRLTIDEAIGCVALRIAGAERFLHTLEEERAWVARYERPDPEPIIGAEG
jgi:hypothetical protein